ncbi:hypothetical protein MD484_g4760, partial [Candolleomyces efflorescens]
MDEQPEQSQPVPQQTAVIFQLPPEILRAIFLVHQAQCRGNGHVYDGVNLEWIRLGHVCRYWRDLSIDYTQLWTTIRVKDFSEKTSSFLKFQLERTKGHIVDLEAFIPNTYGRKGVNDKLVDLIVSLVPRLRSLQLTSDSSEPDSSDLLQKLRKTPAPELESFSLSVRSLVPPDLFNKEAPQLRRVQLCHVRALPSSESVLLNRHDTLTHLDLRSISRYTSDPQVPTWIQLHRLIKSQENTLKALHIHTVLPDDPKVITSGEPLLELPQLAELSLEGKSGTIRAVLRTMRVPPSARVSLDVELDFDRGEDESNAPINPLTGGESAASLDQIDDEFLDTFEALSTARSSTPFEFTHLSIHAHNETCTSPIRIQGWVVGLEETGGPGSASPLCYYKPYHILPVDPPPIFEFSFLIQNWGNIDDGMDGSRAQRVATWFPLSTGSTCASTSTTESSAGGFPGVELSKLRALDVGTMVLYGGAPLKAPRAFWETVAGLMVSNVEMMKLQNLEVGDFVRALKEDSAFPSLRALLLEGAQFEDAGSAFVNEVKRRNESGHRLECLDFGIKCEFGTSEEREETFRVLEKYVDDFNGYWKMVRQGCSNFWRLPSVERPYPYSLS